VTARLAHAYGVFHAVLGSVLIVIIGLALDQKTLGVTRQPLPLVWPLAVLHVTVAQLPLREILGPVERIAVRGPLIRAARALLASALLTLGSVTYVAANGSPAFQIFFLLLAAIGFVTAATGADPWMWTLGTGMAGVGLEFITPIAPISRLLSDLPNLAAATAAGLAACLYVLASDTHHPALRSRPARPRNTVKPNH
jgi:hypothetical protein